MLKYDASGMATVYNTWCSDGRLLKPNSFDKEDGKKIAVVWRHNHESPENVLGSAVLKKSENPHGLRAYITFNKTKNGLLAKKLVQSGDISGLSIYANGVNEEYLEGSNNKRIVNSGNIREVSLVISGSNPKALIDDVLAHDSDGNAYIVEGALIITNASEVIEFKHEETSVKNILNNLSEEKQELFNIVLSYASGKKLEQNEGEENGKSIKHVYEELNEEETNVLNFMVGQLVDNKDILHDEKKENDMSLDNNGTGQHNVFENTKDSKFSSINIQPFNVDFLHEARNTKTLLSSVLESNNAPPIESYFAHDITNINYLFPEAKNVHVGSPPVLARENKWVEKFFSMVNTTPFSRLKSMYGDLTAEGARAKGYVTGNEKTQSVWQILRRTTYPTTHYTKMHLNRDDIVDITDFNVITWARANMMRMHREELARACLIGDGRLDSSDDKINEENIRPIWQDDAVYTINHILPVGASNNDIVDSVLQQQDEYQGGSDPVFFTSRSILSQLLVDRDDDNNRRYKDRREIAAAMDVADIIPVPIMNGLTRTSTAGSEIALIGIVVDLNSYRLGFDRQGKSTWYQQFDIDFNLEKFLLEARNSGALVFPRSAITIERYNTNVEP